MKYFMWVQLHNSTMNFNRYSTVFSKCLEDVGVPKDQITVLERYRVAPSLMPEELASSVIKLHLFDKKYGNLFYFHSPVLDSTQISDLESSLIMLTLSEVQIKDAELCTSDVFTIANYKKYLRSYAGSNARISAKFPRLKTYNKPKNESVMAVYQMLTESYPRYMQSYYEVNMISDFYRCKEIEEKLKNLETKLP